MKARVNSSAEVVEIQIPETAESRELGERLLQVARMARRNGEGNTARAGVDWEEAIARLIPKVAVSKAA